MNRRTLIEISAGVVLALLFFWWLYLREPAPAFRQPDDPAIKTSIESNDNKVLLIGIDAMDWDVAMPLINEGRMPNLARLVRNGAHGLMKSEEPMISPALWTTAATGRSRKDHGITNFLEKVPYQYNEAKASSVFRKVPALWQMMSWAGKSSGVVNWYATYPAEPLTAGGVFVAEEVDQGKMTEKQVWPPEWFERINTEPLPPFQPYEAFLKNTPDSRIELAYRLDRASFSAGLDILREIHPDLMMVYLRQTDVIEHGFWKYRWPLGLDHQFPVSREERDRFGPAIELHYELVDRMIGGLLSEAEGYNVIVMSDHGHGPTWPPKNIFFDLNKLLNRLGFLKYSTASCDDLVAELARRKHISVPDKFSENVFKLCRSMETEGMKWAFKGSDSMPAFAVEAFISTRYKFGPAGSEEVEKERSSILTDLGRKVMPDNGSRDILWRNDKGAGTIAWNVQDFHKKVRGIYINLADREPEGVVPRKNYDSACREVIKALSELRTENGFKVFTSVTKNPDKDVMPLGEADQPDILVEINPQAVVELYAYRTPEDPDPVPLDAIRWSYGDVSGDHQLNGVFLISGPKATTFKQVDLSIYDICPTILWLMGLPVGSDMPGRVVREAFDEPFSEKQILTIESWDKVIEREHTGEHAEMSPEQKKQFRDIGYIQ